MIFQGFYIVLSNGASVAAGLAKRLWQWPSVKAEGTAVMPKERDYLGFLRFPQVLTLSNLLFQKVRSFQMNYWNWSNVLRKPYLRRFDKKTNHNFFQKSKIQILCLFFSFIGKTTYTFIVFVQLSISRLRGNSFKSFRMKKFVRHFRLRSLKLGCLKLYDSSKFRRIDTKLFTL